MIVATITTWYCYKQLALSISIYGINIINMFLLPLSVNLVANVVDSHMSSVRFGGQTIKYVFVTEWMYYIEQYTIDCTWLNKRRKISVIVNRVMWYIVVELVSLPTFINNVYYKQNGDMCNIHWGCWHFIHSFWLFFIITHCWPACAACCEFCTILIADVAENVLP